MNIDLLIDFRTSRPIHVYRLVIYSLSAALDRLKVVVVEISATSSPGMQTGMH